LRLRVEGKSYDPYARYYGLGIDQELNPDFWVSQPHKVRMAVWGDFTDELDVPDRTSFVVVGTSSNAGYYYHIKVYANGRLVGEGDVDRRRFLRVEFAPAPPAPGVPRIPLTMVAPLAFGLALFIPSAYRFGR
jgi:hypothetical protein